MPYPELLTHSQWSPQHSRSTGTALCLSASGARVLGTQCGRLASWWWIRGVIVCAGRVLRGDLRTVSRNFLSILGALNLPHLPRTGQKRVLFTFAGMQTSVATAHSRSVFFICLFIKIMNLCLEESLPIS